MRLLIPKALSVQVMGFYFKCPFFVGQSHAQERALAIYLIYA